MSPFEFEVVEHERNVLLEMVDGSRITQDRYRRNDLAPWSVGMHDVYCGSCQDQILELPSEMDARVQLVEHVLGHVLQDIRAAFLKLGRNGT
jgi:hypothetical protein